MNTKYISVTECKLGMKVAESLYNSFGAIVIIKDTTIDNQVLDRIVSLGIKRFKVYDREIEESKERDYHHVQGHYKDHITEVQNVMTRVSMGLSLDMSKTREIAEYIEAGTNHKVDVIGILNAVRTPEEYIYSHCINVAFISMMIGRWMNCNERTIKHLVQAGLLHDIGKFKISKELITKPGRLTDSEFNEIRKHPIYGYKILKEKSSVHEDVMLGVLMHHEREDGTGYPMKAMSDKINLIAKIVGIADIYDAMTSNKVYKKKQTPFEVFRLMQNDSYGKLHPVILDTFIHNMSHYYIGSKVRLNNDSIGEVVFINPRDISNPIIKIDEEYVDLTQNQDLDIEEIILEDISKAV